MLLVQRPRRDRSPQESDWIMLGRKVESQAKIKTVLFHSFPCVNDPLRHARSDVVIIAPIFWMWKLREGRALFNAACRGLYLMQAFISR